MLSAEFKQGLRSHDEIQDAERQYNAAGIPFDPAFDRIAERVTGGISDYYTSILVRQIVTALLAYLDQEIARCNSPSLFARIGKLMWALTKIFARSK